MLEWMPHAGLWDALSSKFPALTPVETVLAVDAAAAEFGHLTLVEQFDSSIREIRAAEIENIGWLSPLELAVFSRDGLSYFSTTFSGACFVAGRVNESFQNGVGVDSPYRGRTDPQ